MSTRLGLHTGSGKWRTRREQSGGRGWGRRRKHRGWVPGKSREQGACRPREHWEGAGREARTPRPSRQTVPPRGPGPMAALRVHSGPKGTGRLLRSARVGLTARPRELWAARARSLGAGAGGAGPLRPGHLLRLQTQRASSSTRHASHQIGCLFFAACFCPLVSARLQMDPNCSCPTSRRPLALGLGYTLPRH